MRGEDFFLDVLAGAKIVGFVVLLATSIGSRGQAMDLDGIDVGRINGFPQGFRCRPQVLRVLWVVLEVSFERGVKLTRGFVFEQYTTFGLL